MKRLRLSRTATVIALGLVLNAFMVLPAVAQPHYRGPPHGWHHGPPPRAWHGGHYYHDGNDAGAAIAGALLGLGLGVVVGGAIANSAAPPPPVYYSAPPPPTYYAPPPPAYYYGY